jgi:pimeloyl-ACP methyl ester carboxylesterase
MCAVVSDTELALLVLVIVLLGAVSGALWWAHLRFWERRLGVIVPYAEERRIATPDGTYIELRRLSPIGEHESRPPIVLVHGLGANHRNYDLNEDLSLARHLSVAGRDVWLVTLRSGLSRRTRAETRVVRFAAMVHHDLPLAVSTVLEATGAEQVDYIGFSMGGMLLYAAIGHTLPEAQLRRVVIIGSPGLVRSPLGLPLPRFFGRLPAWLIPTARLRLLARSGAFASEWLRTPLHHVIFNPRNVAPGIARMSLVNVIEDVPGPLNLDFLIWAASSDGRLRLDGQDVLERLARVRCPALFFAGAADRIAPPAAVRAAYDAWGSAVDGGMKQFVVLGSEFGSEADYGHGDLAVGRHAKRDLFLPIDVFLGAPAS